jgi:hypothetical protein
VKLDYDARLPRGRGKCTTIAILRLGLRVAGGIGIHIDIHCIGEYVTGSAARMRQFLRQYCHADMHPDENLHSKDEYCPEQ